MVMAWLTNRAEEARKSLLDSVSRFKNREFLEATVAGCALVAVADGTIKPEEKQKMIGFMQMSDELKTFSTEEVIDLFNRATAKFDFDFYIGKMDALKIIGRLKRNPEAARVMVRVCCIIGASDGDFDADEMAVVGEICKVLDLNPTEFGLPKA